MVKTQNNLEENCKKIAGFNSFLLESGSKEGVGLHHLKEYCAGYTRDMAQKGQVIMTAKARLASNTRLVTRTVSKPYGCKV